MTHPTPAGSLALHFFNTRVGLRTEKPQEWIADGQRLLAWLLRAGLISEAETNDVRRRLGGDRLDALAAEARGLREQLRAAVEDWKAGAVAPSRVVLDHLNSLLAAARPRRFIQVESGKLALRASRQLETPQALLAPLAEAFAELLVSGDRRLARVCAAHDCSIWFYDRTKAHRRRWCSMGLCGARAKARAYRRRRRRGTH